MGYWIHIERVDSNGLSSNNPITLSEWKAAIEKLDTVRLASGDYVVTNPITKQVIRFRSSEGDAEVFFPAQSAWSWVYRWYEGTISFKVRPSFFDDPNDVVRQTTRQLAVILDAKIVGDEGEFYD